MEPLYAAQYPFFKNLKICVINCNITKNITNYKIINDLLFCIFAMVISTIECAINRLKF